MQFKVLITAFFAITFAIPTPNGITDDVQAEGAAEAVVSLVSGKFKGVAPGEIKEPVFKKAEELKAKADDFNNYLTFQDLSMETSFLFHYLVDFINFNNIINMQSKVLIIAFFATIFAMPATQNVPGSEEEILLDNSLTEDTPNAAVKLLSGNVKGMTPHDVNKPIFKKAEETKAKVNAKIDAADSA
ncbi:hypothetical protein K502DRAFT_348303 [Neoconidiobolus thromboides FSU 785]|nr:hypothetical protein K502DRAFT_348303 [Neoconidiobolus thromboides FSU 785]